uniref:Uncharacterized protein n=1 Tax=viral metagenome TaxID=1070528 RepID=A0A6C0LVX5_9ZZZZ
MLSKLRELWNNKGFEICLGICLGFLIIFGIYNKLRGFSGTFSEKGKYYTAPKYIHKYIPNKNNTSTGSRAKESKGESECRRVLQSLFNRKFASSRPDFLRNPVTGGNFNLELDCYDSNMKLAVEYNGVQHYVYTPYFQKSKAHFLNQKYRDDMKQRICKENGVVLITVPYTVKIKDIQSFIVNECRKYGYKV